MRATKMTLATLSRYTFLIYWWTATEFDGEQAYMACYNGQVRPRNKDWGPGYYGYRAVKEVD